MKGGYWVLDGHDLVHTDDVHQWGRMFEDNKARTVATTEIGEVFVSTVFLGIDHNWFDEGPPLLFETMIFRGLYDQWQDRYSTWQEAEEGHARVVAAIEAGVTPDA